MDTIPNELLAEILDQLGDDREALRACARVSQRMCAAAQRRLFRRISLVLQGAVPLEIGAAFGLGRPEWFLELVQSPSSTSASLADYVVHLEVHQMSRFPAREGVEAFRALLPMLRNVVEVSFPPVVNSFESYDRYHQVIWAGENGLPALVPDLERMVKGDAIVELDLINVEPFPARELCGRRRRLRRLALGLLDCRAPTPPLLPVDGDDGDREMGLEVDELVLHKAHWHTFVRLIEWLGSAGCVLRKASVRRLEIRTLIPLDPYSRHTGNYVEGWQLDALLEFFPNVEVLHLSPNPDVVSFYQLHDLKLEKTVASKMPCPRLDGLVNLRSLTIQFELYTEFASYRFGRQDTAFGSSLEWVTTLLKSIPLSGPSCIAKMFFILEIKPHGGIPQRYHYKKYFLRIPEWKAFVDALVSGRFPKLREVGMDVLVPGFIADREKAEIRMALRGSDVFCGLRGRGIILVM